MAEHEENLEEQQLPATSTTETIERILAKEAEISARIEQAEKEFQRKIESARLDAAVIRRKGTTEDVGREVRETELQDASKKAEEAVSRIAAEAEQVKKDGMAQIDRAIDIVINGVLPR